MSGALQSRASARWGGIWLAVAVLAVNTAQPSCTVLWCFGAGETEEAGDGRELGVNGRRKGRSPLG